ncbi:MAG: tryptophan synthase subunit alpha [Actinomycetota bacterium]|nr:MAG: tryptophan synthase subunit alpha [Actinomycetota bacterium]
MGALEKALTDKKNSGRKLLVPYINAGFGNWVEAIHAVIDAGADAVEVGIPFSDPIMDGPIIQEASQKALEAGVTPAGILSDLRRSSFEVPLAVMTYYNIVHHAGHDRFAKELAECGVAGSIIPDLQLDEAGEWMKSARENGIDNVMLAAPSTSPERLRRLADNSHGFVYGVGLMGVTGVRNSLAESASEIARRLKEYTSKPVLVGVGVSTADQAIQVSRIADGVIVGSALVRRLLAGGGPQGAFDFMSEFRKALDDK